MARLDTLVDVDRLKRSWAQVATHGDQVPLRFYSRLFVAHPEIREMFPLSLAAQRDKLVGALGYTVSNVDDLEALAPFLQQLGRDHRKFGVVAEHYGPVGEALLATLTDFLGDDWTDDLAQDWADAYGLVAKVMIEAAEAAADLPPWWDAEVVGHERRTFDIAVVTLSPEPALHYAPGQSVAVETPLRPRLWRYYSPANAPRPDGSIELHVRRVPGGQVSSALVDSVRPGDRLRLAAPVGDRLTLPEDGTRDVVMIAGGTGFAPMKALVEEAAMAARRTGQARRVTLFVGVDAERELYDLDALAALHNEHAWLTVIPTVRAETLDGYHRGSAVEVALRLGDWKEQEILVCGSDQMVAASVDRLVQEGYPAEHIRFEGFQGLGGETYGVINRGAGY